MIGEDRAPLPHRFGRHRALVGAQAQADETLGQLAVGLFSHQLVARGGNARSRLRRPGRTRAWRWQNN